MKKASILSLTVFLGIMGSSHNAFTYHNPPKLSEIKQLPTKEVESQADQYFNAKDYERAYYYYLALSQMKARLTIEQEYRLGKSALQSQHYEHAKQYLQRQARPNSKFPLASFEYANALKHTGNYEQAVFFYQEYVAAHQHESNNDYVKIARRHQEACITAIKSKTHAPAVWVEKMGSSFDAGGNTMSITTPSKYQTRLVEYQDAKGTCLKKVMPNMEMLPLQGMAGDPIFNTGSPYMAPDGETVYFTRREKDSNGNPEFKIYSGKITPEGEVGNIQKLNTWVNRDGFSSLYPTLSINEYGQEVLYFASTLPGGEGGFDLWYSVRLTDGTFTRAYNLGMRINTENDEVTPFYNPEAGELYFSSNKPEGFGGYDVYKMTGAKNYWKELSPAHLPMPVNSPADDCFYMVDGVGSGYFSSNRDAQHPDSYKLYQYSTILTAQSQNTVPAASEQKK